MSDLELVLRAPRAVIGAGETGACIGVRNGRIATVAPLSARLDGARIVELAADEVLLPGLVDSHVHVNEPGRTEWEGFASATRAAAAGGVTTILDMPLNSIPPTVDVAALETKKKAADGKCHIDVGFWGGAVPGNLSDLHALHEAGVFGFKCFLLDSGVEEFPPLSAAELEEHLRELAGFDGLMIVHAEDPVVIEQAPEPHGGRYADFLRSRPRTAEDRAIATVVEATRRTGARTHVLHLSSSDGVPLLRDARGEGLPITVETCPHYLTFDAEDVVDGATAFKCCPPIREAANRELLWQALTEGVIDCVVSDHSPCTAELKRPDVGDFGLAWGGISSLQLGLTAVWTEARARGYALSDVVRWMCEQPARVAGLRTKGRLAVGADADFCVFAPDESFVVDPAQLQHRNPVTPYAGRRLDGVVRSTWLRGAAIDIDAEPRGRFLTRGGA
ncbi:allantoinase [Modestobacter sp. DSM 44400]|uniref:allantoinase AllB n=1 Tax=Modestobacter sp. DSM 44400 TaxID=1550230 RepID=UPI00089A0724|nr:allantoinase AllB [Modestobacter sp. DSM 44400]SDX98519.1 allantoinase [Modestobacter sp. DSM 44400]